jgi:hypothetical protein
MRAYLGVILILLSHLAAYPQSISGTITDAADKALVNASVFLLNANDSALVKGAMTDQAGRYSFENIGAGTYMVSSSFAGLKAVYSSSFSHGSQGNSSVSTLRMTEKESELSAVTVVGKKPLFEQKMDRMIINVASSITGVGSTALDVLERAPGIMVDRQNNGLSMNGKSGVVVMLNGKISRMPLSAVVQVLAGMSSSNIEKIELITTPPANYDAEGNAGYINIVLKENTLYGTNGSYSATAGYGKGPVLSASANFNHRTMRTNFFGDFSVSRNAQEQELSFYRKVLKDTQVIENYIHTMRDPVVLFTNGRLGLDYQWNKKTVVGVLVSGFHRNWTMDAVNNTQIYLDKSLDTMVRIDNHEVHKLTNISGNLNMLHNFNEGERLSMDLDYIYYKDLNPVDYVNYYYDGNGEPLFQFRTKSDKETPIKFWVWSADYNKKFSSKFSLETGVKGTWSEFRNDVSVQNKQDDEWETDESLTANYELNESILAAYGSLNIAFNEKNNAKVGLRYEYTNSVLDSEEKKNIVDRHYGRLFPTLFFSHKINEKHSFNFSYSRRITRPTFNDMAPFVIFVDPNTFFSGNPSLQPSISDEVKADYLFKNVVLSVQYTYEADPITNFSPSVDPESNKQTLAAENQKSRKTFNVILSLPIKVNSWWNMQNNFTGTAQTLDGTYKGDPILLKQKSLNARTTQTFSLPKDFSLELSGFFQSPGMFSVYKVNSFGSLDFGAQKKFPKIRSSLRLAYDNILNTLIFKPDINLPEQNLVLNGVLRFTNPTVRLTYTHQFGNDKLKGKRENSSGDDARQRVRSEN